VKISDLRTSQANGQAQVSAMVTWEDSDRPAQTVYFATPLEFADALTTDLDAFLLAAVMPALYHGERRLAVQGTICPVLHEGVRVAMTLLQEWSRIRRSPLILETGLRAAARRAPDRAASFLSGGVDSLATLRNNRLHYPRSHPASIKDGIIVYGLEVEQPQAFDWVLDRLRPVAREAEVTLVPIYTNVRALERDWVFWHDVSIGSIFGSVAHALNRRLTTAYLASSADVWNLHLPTGTHPMLDPNYSSGDLVIRHDGYTHSRLAKVALLADWPVALDHLRVCNKIASYRPETLNCGRCEKCIRTQMELLCVGALERTSVFQVVDLSADAVASVIFNASAFRGYRELIGPLHAAGRDDLSRLAARKVVLATGGDWRSRLADVDRRYLAGSLSRVKRVLT